MPQRWTLRDRPITGPPQPTAHSSTLDNHSERQHQALSQEASIPPGPPGYALRVTIFLLSVPRFACLDMVPTVQCRLASPLRSPGSRPLETPIQPSRGPSASDRPRLTAPAQSGAEHHGTCSSADQSQTTAPDSPTGSPALVQRAPRLAECRDRRPGCATVAARWHPHLVIALYCPQCPYFLPPPRLAPRGSANSSVSRIGFGKSLF